MQKLWIWITICYSVLLAAVSLKDSHYLQKPPDSEILFHNLCHIPAYFILTILLIVSFQPATRKHFGMLCAVAFVYGVLLEFGQAFVPHRYFSIMDMGLNAIGVIFALILVLKFKTKLLRGSDDIKA